MVYRPPAPAPFSSPSHPPAVHSTVDASPNWWQDNSQNANAVASAIVDSYGSEIRQFIQKQRLDYGAGIVPLHRRAVSLGPDLDLFYTNQNGHEALKYVARPENTKLTPTILGLLALGLLAVEFYDGAT